MQSCSSRPGEATTEEICILDPTESHLLCFWTAGCVDASLNTGLQGVLFFLLRAETECHPADPHKFLFTNIRNETQLG